MDYLNDLLRNLSSGDYLINALVAILLLIVGVFIAKLLKKLTAKIIKKSGLDEKLKSDTKIYIKTSLLTCNDICFYTCARSFRSYLCPRPT